MQLAQAHTLSSCSRHISIPTTANCQRPRLLHSLRQLVPPNPLGKPMAPLLPPFGLSASAPTSNLSRGSVSMGAGSLFSSLATISPSGMLAELPAWAQGLAIPLAAVALTAGVVALAAWLDARFKACVPTLVMQNTRFNQAVLSRCPTMKKVYQPTPFFTNGHVETIIASMMRPKPVVPYMREFLRASDGGIVTLDWPYYEDPTQDLPADAPILILLPGLTGGSGCSYVLHAVKRAARHGIRAVVFNSRGTADSPVVTPQFYSASFTGDMRLVVQHVHQKMPSAPLLAAGWSLGANIMMRYLGEQGEDTPLVAAVSMCNPFNLTISNRNWEQGFNKIYDKNLAKALRNIYEKHEKVFRGAPLPMRPDLVAESVTVRAFDEAITIHSFGWPSVDDYYAGSSSSLSVPHIRIPLLCVQALDDPIAPAEAIPYAALEDNPNCVLVCTPTGGHLGWVAAPGGLQGEPWTDQVMAEWLESVLLELKNGKAAKREQQGVANGNGKAVEEAVAARVGAAAGAH